MGENIVAESCREPERSTPFPSCTFAPKKWKIPMCIGYVDLEGGVRVFTHLDGPDLAIGETVEVSLGTVGQDENGAIESFVFKRAKP